MMHARLPTVNDSPGKDVAEVLGLLLKRGTRARIYGELTRDLDPAIDEATYPVISGLARLGPRSAAQLAVELDLDRSVVSRHASRLEQAGLLGRLPDPTDSRATRLELTSRGTRHVKVMRQRLSAILDAYLDTWPPEEAAGFAASFRRFVQDGPFHS